MIDRNLPSYLNKAQSTNEELKLIFVSDGLHFTKGVS